MCERYLLAVRGDFGENLNHFLESLALVSITPELITVVVGGDLSDNAKKSDGKSVRRRGTEESAVKEHADGVGAVRSMVVVERSVLVHERLERDLVGRSHSLGSKASN